MNIDTVNRLRALYRSQLTRLDELIEATSEEAAAYIVDKLPRMDHVENLIVIQKGTGRIVYNGSRAEVIRFLQKREIISVHWRSRTDEKI